MNEYECGENVGFSGVLSAFPPLKMKLFEKMFSIGYHY